MSTKNNDNTQSIIRVKREDTDIINACKEKDYAIPVYIEYNTEYNSILPLNRSYRYCSTDEIKFLIAGLNKSLELVTDAEIEQANEEIKNNEIEYSMKEIEIQLSTPPKRNKKEGHVYFVIDALGNIKIGITKDIKRRLKDFSTSHATDLKLICSIESKDMVLTEELFHNHFSTKRLKGEWFKLNSSDIKYIVDGKYTREIMASIKGGE